MRALRRSFSLRMSRTARLSVLRLSVSVILFVVPTIAYAVDEFSDSSGSEIELRCGLIDDFCDKLVDRAVGVFTACEDEAAINLLEHFSFAAAHAWHRSTGKHGRNDDSRPFLADPEPGRRRIGDALEYFGHDDEVSHGKLLAESSHEVGVSLAGEIEYAAEVLQWSWDF